MLTWQQHVEKAEAALGEGLTGRQDTSAIAELHFEMAIWLHDTLHDTLSESILTFNPYAGWITDLRDLLDTLEVIDAADEDSVVGRLRDALSQVDS